MTHSYISTAVALVCRLVCGCVNKFMFCVKYCTIAYRILSYVHVDW